MLKKWLAVVLVLMMVLTGCMGGISGNDERTDRQSVAAADTTAKDVDGGISAVQVSLNGKHYGAGTVSDLKEKYGDEDRQIMPMYNVTPDHIFTFEFKSDMRDITFGPDFDYKIASVHTDIRALDASMIDSLVVVDRDGMKVTVEPSLPVLKLDSDPISGVWGNAPIFYLRINYDLDSSQARLLDEPIIIPFTIKKEVQTPTLNYEITKDGRLKFVWEPVEGADSYHIYNYSDIFDDSVSTGGAEAAFGHDEFLTHRMIAAVEGTEFDDWGGYADGLYYIASDLMEQNAGVQGDYFITAVKTGKNRWQAI